MPSAQSGLERRVVDDGLAAHPRHVLGGADIGEGLPEGGDGVVRGDTLTDGGGYLRGYVGGARAVCAARNKKNNRKKRNAACPWG